MAGCSRPASPRHAHVEVVRLTYEKGGQQRQFFKVTGLRKGSHARYAARDGAREVVAEYTFDEGAINRAALAIDGTLDVPPEKPDASTKPLSEVLLYFDVASRSAGKEKGRTHDRGIVPMRPTSGCRRARGSA